MLKKIEVINLIEPHFHPDLNLDNYQVKTIPAKDLLVSTRLDIAFKLYYLDLLSKDLNLASEVYKYHIKALSLGTFSEPGNESKNSFIKYISIFDSLLSDIVQSGFDSSKTLIPISKNGSIANGSHRVACAIHLNKSVACVDIGSSDHIYDYNFFYNRNVPRNILDTVVTKFVEYSSNIHIAVIWPTAVGKDKEIEHTIPNIVYRKNISLNPNGAHNFLSQVYAGESWLGNVENNFKGTQRKLVECFQSFDDMRIIAFQANDLKEVLVIKEKIRNLFNVGKHSIHITDTKDEALRTARLVFNDNSIHFLNYAKPCRFLSTHNKINDFKEFIKMNNSQVDDFIIDSSLILSLYGLREASDTDYLTSNKSNKLKHFDFDINQHDDVLVHYSQNKSELLYNQKYHFYFNELKFISFNILYEMKKSRGEEKDINDYKMMDAFLNKNSLKFHLNKTAQFLLYRRVKLKKKTILLLKFMGLFNIIKKLLGR